jgi:predicted membrane protein
MREKINTSVQSASLIIVIAGLAWVVWSNEPTVSEMLSALIILMVILEGLSLYLISRVYPESHTTFKSGMIASLLILLGIKMMLPDMFVSLTITVFAINFLYNFYTNNKRRKGGFKQKRKKKYRL